MASKCPASALGASPQRPPLLSTENRILMADSLLGGPCLGATFQDLSASLASPRLELPRSLRGPVTELHSALALARASPCPLVLAGGLLGDLDTRNRLLGAGSSLERSRDTQDPGGPTAPTASAAPEPAPVTLEKASDACATASLGAYEPGKESEDLSEASAAMPEYDLHLAEMDLGPPAGAEGPDFSQCLPDLEEQLSEKKLALISAVCCSLVEVPDFRDSEDPVRKELEKIAEDVAEADPEFILKVALYTRQELNIRSTANFLLALAARMPATRPHLRRYFCAAVQLPADWMQIPEIYQNLAGQAWKPLSLPSCLRRAMEDKFRQFDEYQLAKYNTRADRGKKPPKKRDVPKPKQPPEQRRSRYLQSAKVLGFALNAFQKQADAQPWTLDPKCKTAKRSSRKERFSMKKLIHRLHIREPARLVMCLLGCRYPSDLSSFSRSRLPGPWDSRLSGKRMKLKQPETWERQLSLRGNVWSAWHELIDHRKLPFMAMLRNLRNMIKARISSEHHAKIIARLSKEESVIRSRQLPFRFLSAYKVIQDMDEERKRAEGPIPTSREILATMFKKRGMHNVAAEKVLSDFKWDRSSRKAAMTMPAVRRLVMNTKNWYCNAQYDDALLKRYRQALEAAIHISAQHNVPPLPGRILILCCVDATMKQPCEKANDLCCPDVMGEETTGKKAPITVLELALLLSLMVRGASEHAWLVLYSASACEEASINSDSILGSVGPLLKQIEDNEKWNNGKALGYNPVTQYLQDLVTHKEKVDNFLMLSLQPPDATFTSALRLYRQRINADAVFVNILPVTPYKVDRLTPEHRNDMTLCGFSEQILRFIAERGGARLLQHVEKIDEIYRIPKQEGALRRAGAVEGLSHPGAYVPKLRWRSVRVFISSTFRDMHGERDLLIRWVFPTLRARAAQHYLSLEEIDLRWGVTEEETRGNRQLSLCLSEVSRCQLFLGILGERYGYVPDDYNVPDVPEHEWLRSYPKGRSITELEIMQFLNQGGSSDLPRAFLYLRDPACLSSVPDCWRKDFAAESPEAKRTMAELKSRVTALGQATCRGYSCRWGGVAGGKPFLQGLEDFAALVLQDIWGAIEKNFVEAEPEEEEAEAVQEAFQEYQQRQFCARRKQLLGLDSGERRPGQAQRGRVILVSGGPSEGKTVFMAGLAHKLRCTARATEGHQSPAPSCDVIFHFTDASPDAGSAVAMLTRVCGLLGKRLEREGDVPRTYRGLVREFDSLLQSASRALRGCQTLTLLVDGADRLRGESGELSSDWIPEVLPQRVLLVLSLDEGSSLQSSLRNRRDVSFLLLEALEPSDRVEIVRRALAVYGKKLEESAFNNQMRLLLIKKGSQKPLYLKLASEDLRAFAVYEKVSGRIQSFPATLPPLLQHILGSLEQEHGAETVALALSALFISRAGLRERDLYAVLCARADLASRPRPLAWEVVLGAVEQQAAGALPMAAFSYLLRSFQSVLGLRAPVQACDPRLQLSGSLLRDAVQQRYLARPGLESEAHLFLASHLWRSSDPLREDPARKPDAESLRALPYHLVHCGYEELLGLLLTDLRFLSLHAELAQLPHLCEVYSLYSAATTTADGGDRREPPSPTADVEVYREFAQRHAAFLSRYPSLIRQQVLNEPEASPVCQQAQRLLGKGGEGLLVPGKGSRVMKWANKPSAVRKADSKVMPIPSTPSCVSISPAGRTAAVGTSEGSLHLLDLESGQEVRSLATGCDGISACVFLAEGTLCVASFDGRLEVWKTRDGCRLHLLEAHQRGITGCVRSPDGKWMVSVSLDRWLKLWDSSRGILLGSWQSPRPLNCVAFHPEGQLLAVGSWDRLVCVLRSHTWESESTLSGHGSPVRDLSFSPAGNVLASAALDGEVRLWAWRERVLLAAFQAHQGAAEVAQFVGHGQFLVTAGEDRKVQLWSGHLGQMRETYGRKCTSPALCLSVSPKGEVSGRRAPVRGGNDLQPPRGLSDSEVRGQELGGAGAAVAAGGAPGFRRERKALRLWCVAERAREWGVCEGHGGAVLSLAYSRGGLPGFCLRRSPCPPWRLCAGHTAGVTCCAFSPDGGYLATGSKDRSLMCWDVSASPPCLVRQMPASHRDWVTGCAWTAASRLLSCSKRLHRVPVGSADRASSCGTSWDTRGDWVVSASRDGALKVWDQDGVELTSILPAQAGRINQCAPACTRTGLQVGGREGVRPPGHHSLGGWELQALAPPAGGASCHADGPRFRACVRRPLRLGTLPFFLTVARDHSLRLWPLPSREGFALAGDKAARQHSGAVTAVAWSPDGKWAASASDGGDVVIWREAKAVHKLQVSERAVRALLFVLPMSFLAVSDDQKVSRWDLDSWSYLDSTDYSATQSYSLDTKSLVMGMGRAPSSQVLLGTVGGNLLVLDSEKGSLYPVSCTLGYQAETFHSQISAMEGDQVCLLENSHSPALHLTRVTKAGDFQIRTLVDLGAWKGTERLHQITQAHPEFGLADSGGSLWVETRRAEKKDFERDHWDVQFATRKKRKAKRVEKQQCLTVLEVLAWERKQIHNDAITALHVLDDHLITASLDRDVKLWDRDCLKQLGLFRCDAPVTCLQPNPCSPSEIVCGDALGNVYFLASL
ncbi:LOW QUALITY PROTEIN: telomerase protein component 1 [Rhinatrema bivittatum]|uniref:LOW QUALITY PROTEIN: telomerase protein component 1 n=1 Tax=Rhinatrema bivittatum TaxID=194408 RepID=UPI001125D6B8|nr:LOW QUALITY PROTEIN: telomerase protein component 1 [Rhinatrema bivittatum]